MSSPVLVLASATAIAFSIPFAILAIESLVRRRARSIRDR